MQLSYLLLLSVLLLLTPLPISTWEIRLNTRDLSHTPWAGAWRTGWRIIPTHPLGGHVAPGFVPRYPWNIAPFTSNAGRWHIDLGRSPVLSKVIPVVRVLQDSPLSGFGSWGISLGASAVSVLQKVNDQTQHAFYPSKIDDTHTINPQVITEAVTPSTDITSEVESSSLIESTDSGAKNEVEPKTNKPELPSLVPESVPTAKDSSIVSEDTAVSTEIPLSTVQEPTDVESIDDSVSSSPELVPSSETSKTELESDDMSTVNVLSPVMVTDSLNSRSEEGTSATANEADIEKIDSIKPIEAVEEPAPISDGPESVIKSDESSASPLIIEDSSTPPNTPELDASQVDSISEGNNQIIPEGIYPAPSEKELVPSDEIETESAPLTNKFIPPPPSATQPSP